MISTLFLGKTDLRWLLQNYALVNSLGFGVGLAQGAAVVTQEGGIAGWSGSPVEQVVWHAVATVLFTTATFGLPVLASFLIAWRLATRALGHSRLAALVIVGVVLILAAAMIPRTDAAHLVLLLGFPAIVFAATVRERPAAFIGPAS